MELRDEQQHHELAEAIKKALGIELRPLSWEKMIADKQGTINAYPKLLQQEDIYIKGLLTKTFKTTEDQQRLTLAQYRRQQIELKLAMLDVAKHLFELLVKAYQGYQTNLLASLASKIQSLENSITALITVEKEVHLVLATFLNDVFTHKKKYLTALRDLPQALQGQLDQAIFQQKGQQLAYLIGEHNRICLFKKTPQKKTPLSIPNEPLTTIHNPLFGKTSLAPRQLRQRSSSHSSFEEVQADATEQSHSSLLKRTLSTPQFKKV